MQKPETYYEIDAEYDEEYIVDLPDELMLDGEAHVFKCEEFMIADTVDDSGNYAALVVLTIRGKGLYSPLTPASCEKLAMKLLEMAGQDATKNGRSN